MQETFNSTRVLVYSTRALTIERGGIDSIGPEYLREDFWVAVNVSAHLDQSRIVEDRIVGDLIDTDDLKVMREIERIAHRGRDRIRWDWHCLFVLFGILLLMIAFAGNDDTTHSTASDVNGVFDDFTGRRNWASSSEFDIWTSRGWHVPAVEIALTEDENMFTDGN